MKRFVTYLYECQRGNKSKNVGFIRVNVRDERITLEVYLRNLVRAEDVGKIFLLIYKEDLYGIELGEVKIQNGQSDSSIEVKTEDIKVNDFSLENVEGIGIRLDSGVYIASCWKDGYAEYIVRGEFKEEKQSVIEMKTEEEIKILNELVAAEEGEKFVDEEKSDIQPQPITQYEKIDLSQIRDLPSPNWHLAANSFLVHGFWNYGYLVLKKDVEKGQKTLSLGVPGIYEKPEAVMAVLFGFPNFETVPQETVESQKEKNQEAKDGTFGCWFVDLKV